MRFMLQVFCLAKESILRKQIAEFLLGEGFFDNPDAFSPAPSAPASIVEGWDTLQIDYGPRKNALILLRDLGSHLLQHQIQELLLMVNSCARSVQQLDIRRHLQEVSQAFTINIDHDAIPANGWLMLDALESYLAHKLDGVIYAPGEGFFNSKLEHLFLLPEKSVILPFNRVQ